MANKTLIVAGATALLAASADAAVVTRWTFNGGSLAAASGSGSVAPRGGTSLSFTGGSAFDTSTGPNRSVRVDGFSGLASQSGRRGIQFGTSTDGFGLVSVSFAIGGHLRSSRWGMFQYSTNDGLTYTAAGLDNGGRFRLANDGSFKRVGFDLSFLDGVDDNPSFRFRIVAVADPLSGQMRAVSGATVASSGFWRLDNVSVQGTSLATNSTGAPAPGAIALLAAAGMVGATRRRA